MEATTIPYVFKFSHKEYGSVCAFKDEDGTVLFKACDIAAALKYSHPKLAVDKLCRKARSVEIAYFGEGGKRLRLVVKYIPEQDVYNLILRSRKPHANEFQNWIIGTVLPMMRKELAAKAAEALLRAMTDTKFLVRLAIWLDDERSKRLAAEEKATLKQKQMDELYEEIRMLNGEIQAKKEEIRAKDQIIRNGNMEIDRSTSYVFDVLNSNYLWSSTEIAQDYRLTGSGFNRMLEALGIHMRVKGKWILNKAYLGKGFVQSKTFICDGQQVETYTGWTLRGRKFLYDVLKRIGILPTAECNQPCLFD